MPEIDPDLHARNGQETPLKVKTLRLSLFHIRKIKEVGSGSFTRGFLIIVNTFFKGK